MKISQNIPSAAHAKVKIKTCNDVYSYWRTKKRHYKSAPLDGIEFLVEYVDTGLALDEQARAEAPIVLALHGAPGSYNDFSLLIKHLYDKKVRVIVPNFPEYVATVKTKVLFRHSADEKAEYLRDFLKAINIFSIDLLVLHSSAIFPALLILMNGSTKSFVAEREQQPQTQTNNKDVVVLRGLENDICDNNAGCNDSSDNSNNKELPKKHTNASKKTRKPSIKKTFRLSSTPTRAIVKFDRPFDIKSLALLNPAGHRLPMSMKPVWFKCGSVPIYQHKLGRSLFRKLGPVFLPIVGVPVRVDNMDNVMLSATVMRNSKCCRVEQQLQQLSEMKLPTLLVFSENDKLIEKEIFYEMSDFMNLNSKNFDIFNNDGNIELSQSSNEDWIRVMVFKAGGHYAYSNYAKTVNKAVGDLLEKVSAKNVGIRLPQVTPITDNITGQALVGQT